MKNIFNDNLPQSHESLSEMAHLYPGMDPLSMQTYLLFRKICTELYNTLDQYFNDQNLSMGRFTLLMILFSSPEGKMPSELANVCGVTQATISGLLTGLEKSELITRHSHNHDARACVIKLSTKGTDLLNNIMPDYFARIKRLFGVFSDTEKQDLNNKLEHFVNQTKHFTNPLLK